MSRNMFENIKRFLHFVDNSTKPNNPPRDFKFRPLLDSFNATSAVVVTDEYLVVDEQILPYKGKKSGGLL